MNLYEETHSDLEVTVDVHTNTNVLALALADETTLTVYLSRDDAMDLIGALQDGFRELDQ